MHPPSARCSINKASPNDRPVVHEKSVRGPKLWMPTGQQVRKAMPGRHRPRAGSVSNHYSPFLSRLSWRPIQSMATHRMDHPRRIAMTATLVPGRRSAERAVERCFAWLNRTRRMATGFGAQHRFRNRVSSCRISHDADQATGSLHAGSKSGSELRAPLSDKHFPDRHIQGTCHDQDDQDPRSGSSRCR